MKMPHKLILGKSETQILIAGPAGQLELLSYEAPRPRACAVICHPHPVEGGTMQHKVVTILHKAFAELNCHTIRFNFRGVGGSEGRFDNGVGEQDDLLAVLAWKEKTYPDLPLYLAGFSFGSYISYAISVNSPYSDKVVQLVSVAPPVQYPEFHQLPFPSCPWLVVQGDQDDIVKASEVYEWIDQAPHVETITFPEAGHFFHGQLLALQTEISAKLVLPQ